VAGVPDRRVVTIIGLETTSLKGADLAAEHGELWGINAAFTMEEFEGARWTRWFEMHALDYLRHFCPERWEWCRALEIPCYMLECVPEIPASVAYPRAEVNMFLASEYDTEFDYFTSSFSYMLALALYEGFEEINLHGVDLSHKSERALERPGTEYLIGLARGAGVRVTISEASPLLYTPWPYGYDEPRMRVSAAKLKLAMLWLKLMANKLRPTIFGRELRRLKGERIWLETYAHRGTLLRKDGRVN